MLKFLEQYNLGNEDALKEENGAKGRNSSILVSTFTALMNVCVCVCSVYVCDCEENFINHTTPLKKSGGFLL